MASCYGNAYQAKVTAYSVIEDPDTGAVGFRVGVNLIKRAVNPSELGKNAVWKDVEPPQEKAMTFWVTEKALSKKPLHMAVKALGGSEPLELIDPETGEGFNPIGRTVVAVCDELDPESPSHPDNSDYDPTAPLPEERWRFLWAISSGKQAAASNNTRINAIARLRAAQAKASAPSEPEPEPATSGTSATPF